MSYNFPFDSYGCPNGASEVYTTYVAHAASEKAQDAQSQIMFMRADIERLIMISHALWSILEEKHELKDEELVEMIHELDLRDGKLNGRVEKRQPRVCSACGRRLLKSQYRCLYCGAPAKPDPFAPPTR